MFLFFYALFEKNIKISQSCNPHSSFFTKPDHIWLDWSSMWGNCHFWNKPVRLGLVHDGESHLYSANQCGGGGGMEAFSPATQSMQWLLSFKHATKKEYVLKIINMFPKIKIYMNRKSKQQHKGSFHHPKHTFLNALTSKLHWLLFLAVCLKDVNRFWQCRWKSDSLAVYGAHSSSLFITAGLHSSVDRSVKFNKTHGKN